MKSHNTSHNIIITMTTDLSILYIQQTGREKTSNSGNASSIIKVSSHRAETHIRGMQT